MFAVTVCGEQGKFSTSPKNSGSTGTPPSGTWVFPPQDTTVVSGDSFLASFQATDGGGVSKVTFSAYSVQGDSSLGTFSTTQRYRAIGATMPTPQPKDTTLSRFFVPLPGEITDSVFLAATVTNIGGRSATIVRRIQVMGDTVTPGDTIQLPAKTPTFTIAVGDSVLVRTHVMDNRGVVRLVLTGVAKRGSVLLGTDTVVTRYTSRTVTLPQSKDTVVSRFLRAATPIDSTGEYVYLIATATDSAGNKRADSTVVRVVSGPRVTILSPSDSSVTSINKIITITVHAKGTLGVKVLGWRATGVVTDSQSISVSPAAGVMPDTLTFTSNLTIPAATPVGQFTITAFATDSNNNPSAVVSPRTVFVQSTLQTDVTPPLVTFSVPKRVEVGDSITVSATDPGGITRIGFIVRALGSSTIIHGDSLVGLSGSNTNVIARFRLNLDALQPTTTPIQVTVEAFAADIVPNRGVSSFSGTPKASPADQDTLTVVAGQTVSFPQGGQFGDAIVNKNRNELYITNTQLDQVEVFDLGTNSFGSAIPVGSRPVGIALWPTDTAGGNLDRVIVANSGGTNLSIVDVAARRELSRRRLPNWSLTTIKTQANSGGGLDTVVTGYELADRPQYLGAVCRRGGSSACDSVIAVYSTTPTGAQSSPFANRGYVAWENISVSLGTHGAGHLFYEQATRGTTQDSLQIVGVRDTLPGVPIRDTIVGYGAGIIRRVDQIAFQDSTFVRNSGNFVHALLGEGGGGVSFARALMYDGTRGVATVTGTACNPAAFVCQAQVDAGVSPAVYVSDFLVNHASRVLSIATNFNGRTNLVRADSIYAFDFTLRQQGLLQVPSGLGGGMDFDPSDSSDATTHVLPKDTSAAIRDHRVVFAARPDAGIDVFDTYWYQRVGTVPIRDTIIGPIRVASSAGTTVLAGVTSRGVVVVRLPAFNNPILFAQPALPLNSRAQPGRIVRAWGTKTALRP